MTRHPVMFTFRDAVSGNGFLGGVTLSGRALMVPEEDGKWWVYGVRPGAIAESGATFQEAYLRFKNTYKNVLFDIATEAKDYDAFRQEVERFFYEPDTEEEQNWTAALEELRAGKAKPDDSLAEVPREAPESRPTGITVERLDKSKRFAASDNVPDTFVLAPAA